MKLVRLSTGSDRGRKFEYINFDHVTRIIPWIASNHDASSGTTTYKENGTSVLCIGWTSAVHFNENTDEILAALKEFDVKPVNCIDFETSQALKEII